MSKENQELWKAIMDWLEIARETDKRLAQVRAELVAIGSREEPQQDLLKVQLY